MKKRRVTYDCIQSGLQHFTAVLSGRSVYSLRKFAVSQSHKPKSYSVNGIYKPEVRTVVF